MYMYLHDIVNSESDACGPHSCLSTRNKLSGKYLRSSLIKLILKDRKCVIQPINMHELRYGQYPNFAHHLIDQKRKTLFNNNAPAVLKKSVTLQIYRIIKSMSRLTFREVNEADYEAVMQVVSGAWGGRDYLPDKYLDFIADPDCRCFVCELDGEMIGFHVALIVDGGEMMLRIGGRVKVTHQGHGVYHALQRHMYMVHRDYPSLQRECIIMHDEHADRVRGKYVKQMGYSEVGQKKRYLYVFETGKIPTDAPISQNSQNVLKELTGSDLEQLFISDAQRTRLFPDGRIYMHCKPFKAVSSNIRHFTHKSIIFASSRATSSASENRRCFLDTVSLLTIGNYYRQQLNKSLHYNIELYGEDLDVFQNHLERHFAHVQSLTAGYIELFVHTYVSVDVTRIDEVMAKYDVTRSTDYIESVRLFERPFELALKEAEDEKAGEFNL